MKNPMLIFTLLLDWAIVIGVYVQFFAKEENNFLFLLLAAAVGVLLTLINVWFFRKTMKNKE